MSSSHSSVLMRTGKGLAASELVGAHDKTSDSEQRYALGTTAVRLNLSAINKPPCFQELNKELYMTS